MKKIGVAVIACGGRSRYVVKNLLRDAKDGVEILAAYDPDDQVVELAMKEWNTDETKCKKCATYEEAINTNGVDWVMVFSPNAYHKEHILASFAANKHVFTEKPLATTVDDCQDIFSAYQKSNNLFATGFVLRYAPIYRKVKEILESGKLGQLLSIEANENITPEHGGYIMANWRRHKSVSGPHILEKCCHDLDLINWFCQSLPTQVSAVASHNVFCSKNRGLEDKYGKEAFSTWVDYSRLDTPFNDDNDLQDTFMGTALYRNGVQVSFCATMCNALPERRMRFNCSEGTMIAELYSSSLKYTIIKDEEVHCINFNGDGHGGGDDFIMKELFDSMQNLTAPKCSGSEGLESAVFALCLDQAASENTIINIEPVWKKLDR